MNATIQELRQESASKAALVTRLRQDADAAEKVHATRTAVIGTMEAEQARLKERVSQLSKGPAAPFPTHPLSFAFTHFQ